MDLDFKILIIMYINYTNFLIIYMSCLNLYVNYKLKNVYIFYDLLAY